MIIPSFTYLPLNRYLLSCTTSHLSPNLPLLFSHLSTTFLPISLLTSTLSFYWFTNTTASKFLVLQLVATPSFRMPSLCD